MHDTIEEDLYQTGQQVRRLRQKYATLATAAALALVSAKTGTIPASVLERLRVALEEDEE